MSNADATNQDSNIQIPRRGQIMAKTVDATARAINLQLLAFNGVPFNAARRESVFINLVNESTTTTIYLQADPAADTDMDPAAILLATDPASFPVTHGYPLLPLAERSFRIFRNTDLFLVVRTASGTAKLVLTTSSDNTPRLY